MRRFVGLRVSSFLNRLRTGSLVAMDWDPLSPRRHKTKSVLMISLSDHGRRQSVGFPGLRTLTKDIRALTGFLMRGPGFRPVFRIALVAASVAGVAHAGVGVWTSALPR